MGETIRLTSALDGFTFDAYHATPTDARRGGLLLIQEIFGVTDHIRELCDGFAADGYEVIAPSFYDRLERGFAAAYDQAAIDALKAPVFVTGFCWGGAATWLVACRCSGVAAASSFYGRRISELQDETPRAPIIMNFGKKDASIPTARVDEIRERH